MVGFLATRQGPGFQWVKWSEISWPRLVDIPPERQMTWFARTTPKAPPAVVATTTEKSPSQGDGAADDGNEQEETLPATALPEEGIAPASPAGVEVAPPAAESDSAVEGAPEAPVAESLAEAAASQDDAELPKEEQEDPGRTGDGEKTPERAPSVQEEIPPTQTEDPAPSPAKPAEPKEDDAKSVSSSFSSSSSEHTVQPPSDVAKGKRKCVDFASSEEGIPFNSSHRRSFPLVRKKSLSSLLTPPPRHTTKSPLLAMMGYEEGEPSRPSRSVLAALGLRESDWDNSILTSTLPPTLPSELPAVVPRAVPEPAVVPPKPVAAIPNPAVVAPKPISDVTDHVYDLPKRADTLPEPIRTPPTMSGALPVPDGWQPEPIDTTTPAEVPKIRWTSLLLRKLRNAALPRPILQLLLGREVADQVKAALELYASGAA